MGTEETSLETIVQDHERRITDNSKRIAKLEENDLKTQVSLLRIESTVLQEGREQRQKIDKFHESLMAYFVDERKAERTDRIKLSEVRWTSIVGLLGGASAVTLGIQWLIEKL